MFDVFVAKEGCKAVPLVAVDLSTNRAAGQSSVGYGRVAELSELRNVTEFEIWVAINVTGESHNIGVLVSPAKSQSVVSRGSHMKLKIYWILPLVVGYLVGCSNDQGAPASNVGKTPAAPMSPPASSGSATGPVPLVPTVTYSESMLKQQLKWAKGENFVELSSSGIGTSSRSTWCAADNKGCRDRIVTVASDACSCSGALIDKRVVVTNRHCVAHLPLPKECDDDFVSPVTQVELDEQQRTLMKSVFKDIPMMDEDFGYVTERANDVKSNNRFISQAIALRVPECVRKTALAKKEMAPMSVIPAAGIKMTPLWELTQAIGAPKSIPVKYKMDLEQLRTAGTTELVVEPYPGMILHRRRIGVCAN